METIKVSHSRIVFNNGKVEIYDNVILVFKENFIAIAKDKNFIPIAKDKNFIPIAKDKNFIPIAKGKNFIPIAKGKNDTVIIPYSNIMSIYYSENK